MTTRPLVVLGATGSIGRQTLEVAAERGLEVAAVAARRPGPELAEIAAKLPDAVVVATGGSRDERTWFRSQVANDVRWGTDALLEVSGRADSVVVNGLVGSAGLRPTMAALEAGNRVALANKESLVAAGPLVTATAARTGGEIIPVDSEHSALFQLVAGASPAEVESLVLTASGGPFRGWKAEQLADVTPAQALAHPTWDMGRRISVDSATLANKGLEVIEAHVLFGIAYERIDVVVHPQSLVHSLIRLTDGSFIAHVGAADMRIPIAYAITHPERVASSVGFDLAGTNLEFHPVDRATFRALDLAYESGSRGGLAPCVFNAADEIAVQAFLDGRLGFMGIAELIERTIEATPAGQPESIDHVLEVDAEARATAAALVAGAC
ncbi:MAG: 1-deoxy-D-xylulose-5-phosphate reductoisomerase [Acidimicrobiia bacterium]